MFAFLKSRLLLAGLGFVLLGLFIWYAGPYFAFAGYQPLASEMARAMAIGVVVAAWAVSKVVKQLRANRASDKLVAAVVKQAHDGTERPSAEAVQLRERFEDAVATLKKTRRGGHSLYELPWYVIIGAPGSGKTTALVNSGLNFPLEQRTGKGALRGVGGTRNCDWWFTDEAVFLDTAGRYTTQDSDAHADSAAWSEFLALLRKYRRRRPVNGIILTVSAHDLMVPSHAAREAHVDAARRRLAEINRELKIQLPVYLMVTKCDLVSGFTEYFDDLAQEGRAQVWGVTFPYEQTTKGEAAKRFPAELDELITRLNARVFARLEEERDTRRRAKVFAFPQQMAALREALTEFVGEVCASTRFDQQVLLRGVYFTSGTQEGTPIDRLLGALGRRFAVAPDAMAAPPGRGKAYFIQRLLTGVLLSESGLAGINRRLEVQKAAAQLGAYAAMVLVAVLGLIAFSVSYARNRAYVDAVAADLDTLRGVPPVAPTATLETALPRLDAVRAVADSAGRYRDDTPFAMRWGLYQGASLGNAARDAYVRELDGVLLPRVAARFKQRLVEYAAEPEKLYEYLKAYVMLGRPEHLDETHLAALTDYEWERAYEEESDTRASLSRHFHSLLDVEHAIRPVTLDDALVTTSRSIIQRASIPALMFSQIRLAYTADSERALRLDQAAGVGAERVLRRKNRQSLSEPVPSLYTKPVFEEIRGRGTAALVKEFAKDSWLWGDQGLSVVGTATLSTDLMNLYEDEYIKTWERVLNELDIAQFGAGETAQALLILSGPSSPLRGYLKVVDDNTFLVKPEDANKPPSALTDRLNILLEKGKEKVGIATAKPGAKVTARFAAIHRLLEGAPGSAPIDAVLGKMGQLQQELAPVGETLGQQPLDAQKSAAVGRIVQSMKLDAASLPSSVGSAVARVGDLVVAVTAHGIRGILERTYQQVVLQDCLAAIDGRYPFVPDSARNVALDDFGHVFGYNGVFHKFFQETLQQYVDTTRTPWVWRRDASGASVGGSDAMLRQFQVAERIRQTFFRSGSQKPELAFTITPVELDAAATRFVLELDGQAFEYRHGPERPSRATWPGPNPGTAAATFESRSGGRPNLPFEGPWAWFRLVDAGDLRSETELRHMVSFASGGHQARVRIDASSVWNPWVSRDWQQFRCVLNPS
jgi:type VI secretion system protein ImpL